MYDLEDTLKKIFELLMDESERRPSRQRMTFVSLQYEKLVKKIPKKTATLKTATPSASAHLLTP